MVFQWGLEMLRFIIVLAASVSLAESAHALSVSSGTETDPPDWIDIYAGYANVTSDLTVGTPSSAAIRQNITYGSIFLETFFTATKGPITSSTFTGAFNQSIDFAGTYINDTTRTLVGFGPGGADNPIFATGVGSQLFSLSAGFATYNPTLGSISGFQSGDHTSLSFTQSGSDLTGSFSISDATATRTIEFVTTPDFEVIHLSPPVSAVPLPTSLPMFASALIALGLFAFLRRPTRLRKDSVA